MSAIGVRQAVLATAGEGMWNAGAFYAELDPFTLVLAQCRVAKVDQVSDLVVVGRFGVA